MSTTGDPAPRDVADLRSPPAGEAGGRVPGLPLEVNEDWPTAATDQVVRWIDVVRDATTTRAITAATVIKYGFVVGVISVLLFIFLVIAAMRGAEAALIGVGLTDPMWIVYLVFGAFFALIGIYAWRRGDRAPA